jgi:peptide/nickel transport system ATP-binding protein
MTMSDNILEVKNLKKYFKTKRGILQAVDDVSFTLERGKTLGLVGESGCGKSTTGRSILRLIEPTGGDIIFEGMHVQNLSRGELRHVRKDMQLIFQDPYSSLDPRKTVSQLIAEPIIANRIMKSKSDIDVRVAELMSTVGLAPRLFNTYPHELDGGRRQRIGIARALAMEPKFIVCDEPVSALDVSIQAQIINLFQKLQKELGLTYIFVAHDLAVVRHIAKRIGVMYLGHLVEVMDSKDLYRNSRHPYSLALLAAVPTTDYYAEKTRGKIVLEGEVPSPINAPSGCPFHPRCKYASDLCKQVMPELKDIGGNHFVACHNIPSK